MPYPRLAWLGLALGALLQVASGPAPSAQGAPTAAPPGQATPAPGSAGTDAIDALAVPGMERFTITDFGHVPTTVTYPQVPPVGGNHNPAWLNCGVYAEPVRNEQAVHSLEHGAVWITYRPELAADDVARLRALARGQTHVLVTPWGPDPPLPSPVVASAWGLQLKVEAADDPRLAQFVQNFQQGPQNPEPGAPCSGAVGTPLPNP